MQCTWKLGCFIVYRRKEALVREYFTVILIVISTLADVLKRNLESNITCNLILHARSTSEDHGDSIFK